MRIHFMICDKQSVSRRMVYRFFKDYGAAGIDVCLLSLADRLAAAHGRVPIEKWLAELDVVEAMLVGWFEQHDQVVAPPRLVTGKDLMRELRIKPGKRMGALLSAIEEAQACREVTDRAQALAFARVWLEGEG